MTSSETVSAGRSTGSSNRMSTPGARGPGHDRAAHVLGRAGEHPRHVRRRDGLLEGDDGAREVDRRLGHLGDARGVHVGAAAGRQLELVQPLDAGEHAARLLLQVEVEREVGGQLVAVGVAEGGQPRAAELLLALADEDLPARAGRAREGEDARGERALGVGRAAGDHVAVAHVRRERLDRPLRARRLHVVHAVAQHGRPGAVDHADHGRAASRRARAAALARRPASIRPADGVGGGAQVAVGRRHRRDAQEVADALEVGVEVAVDRLVRAHDTPASRMSSVLAVASSRARAPSGIVAIVLPWPTGTLAIAGMPSGAISSSRISSIERFEATYSGTVWSLEVDVGAEHEAGRVVELAGEDQVVEVRVDHVRLLVEVLEQHDAAVGLDLVRRAEAGGHERQAAADDRRLGDALADGQHVRVVGVLGHAAERLGLEGAVEALLGDLGQLVLLAREAREHRAVEGRPVRVPGERQVQRRDVAVAAEDARLAERVPVDQPVQPRGAVAALEAEHHVDPRLAQRPLHVGGALLVGAGQVAVHAAVVGAEDELVAARLEVRGRLLDPRADLRRARRRDDRRSWRRRAAQAASHAPADPNRCRQSMWIPRFRRVADRP